MQIMKTNLSYLFTLFSSDNLQRKVCSWRLFISLDPSLDKVGLKVKVKIEVFSTLFVFSFSTSLFYGMKISFLFKILQ